MQTPSKPFSFPKALDYLIKVKFGGAVGKYAAIAVAAILICGVGMVSGWGQERVVIAAILAVVCVVWLAFTKIEATLKENPDLALLDGAEIVAIRKMEMASKNNPSIELKGPPVLGAGDAKTLEAGSPDKESRP